MVNLKTKLNIFLYNIKFALKTKYRKFFGNFLLNIKYSRAISKLFSKLNHKVLIILLFIYIVFIGIQLKIFNQLWKPPDVSDLPKVKNYLASYIYKHKFLKEHLNVKILNLINISDNFAKNVAVPFQLNWMFRIQQELKKFHKENPNIKNFFVFNYHGRLVNYIPKETKYLNNVYTYASYLKESLPKLKKLSLPLIYYYIDSDYFLSLLKDKNYFYRGRFYNLEPFIHMQLFNDYLKKDHKYLNDLTELFTETRQLIPYIVIFSPLFNQNFKFIGTAGITVDISDIFYDTLKANSNNFKSFVVNEKGYLIYAINNRHIGENLLRNRKLKKIITSDKKLIILNSKAIFLKDKLNIHNWYLISQINPELALFTYKRNPNFDLMLYLFFIFELFMFFILFLLFNKYVTKPVEKISNSLKHIIKGDSLDRIYLEQNDEFKVLENRYNLMMDKIGGYLIFGKTMSQEIVEEFIDHNHNLNISPKNTIATVLLIRIKNFDKIKKSYSVKEFDILLNKFLNEIEITISKYKGYVDYFSADAILAVFGIPLEKYNDAVNGYESAKKILKKISMLNKLNNSNIKISISINTGEINYSQMQSNFGKILIALGDTIREAYLFDSILQPNILALGENTYKKIGGKRRKINKVVTIKERDYNKTIKVYLKKM